VSRQFGSGAAPGADCRAEFATLGADITWLTSIALVAPDGTPTCSFISGPGAVASIADRSYFQTALATGTFVVSDLLVSRVSGLPVVVAALPWISNGAIGGVVVAGIDLGELGIAAVAAGDPGDGTVTALLDRNATVVGAAPAGGVFATGQDLAGSALWAATAGASGVLPSVSHGGRDYIVAYADFPATSGRVLVLRDLGLVLADTNARALRSLVAFLVAVIAVCLVVWLGGETLILRPLAAIRGAAGRIASGQLARIDTKGFVPELRQLGERINSMSEELAARNAELNAANLRLAELALRDGLTDLGNRRAFEERVALEVDRCARERKPLALLLLDIDRFKQFNDHYGHFAGDDALRRVASVVAANARRASDFAARIGGEEFALLLPDCSQADALAIARRVVADVAGFAIPHVASEEGVVTVSVGVAGHRMVPGVSVRGLLESADQALYSAKRHGRNAAATGPDIITLVS
jgi:diguanylate cyclase (GGDEF)-like protein